jgi:hypothetical protein
LQALYAGATASPLYNTCVKQGASMRRRSRACGFAKWCALGMCLLLLVALLVNLPRAAYVLRPGDRTLKCNGKTVHSFKDMIAPSTSAGRSVKLKVRDRAGNVHIAYLPARASAGMGEPTFISLALGLVIMAGLTVFLFWRERRRYPPGHCQTCGYNLIGNVSGRCPECGEGA